MYRLHGELSPTAIPANANAVLTASEDEFYRQAHWINAYIVFLYSWHVFCLQISAISLLCLLFLKYNNENAERKGKQRTPWATELCNEEVINPGLVHLIFSQHNEYICFALLLSFVVKDTTISSMSEDESVLKNYFSLAFTQSNLTWRQHLSNNFLFKVKSLFIISSSTTKTINLSESQLEWHWMLLIFCLRNVRRMGSVVMHWYILFDWGEGLKCSIDNKGENKFDDLYARDHHKCGYWSSQRRGGMVVPSL